METYKLELLVDVLACEAGIQAKTWLAFADSLGELREHNARMWEHSLRVGAYSYGLAEEEGHSDLKFPLFAGCGHDLGKCEVLNVYLDAKELTAEEFEHIKEHARFGFEKLKGKFLYTSFVAGLHHGFQEQPYGIDLEQEAPTGMQPEQLTKISEMARLVSIADFFDALTTRKNNKGYIDDPDNPEEQRAVLRAHFPDQENRIEWLIGNKL